VLLLVIAAFGLGVLAFAGVLLKERRQNDFYRPAAIQPVAADQKFAPLPEPSLSDAGSAGQIQTPDSVDDVLPQLVEDSVMPGNDMASVEPAATDPVPVALPEIVPEHGSNIAVQDSDPLPLPDHSPLPQYPARALRRGDSGTVRVRVEVDAGGNPTKVTLVERSGSRQLDRAAQDAVQQWRFKPAQREGRAVPGVVVVPIDFGLN
jgi:protein TonB